MSEEISAEASPEQPAAAPSLDELTSQFAADLPDPVTPAAEQTKPAESPVIPSTFDPLDEASVKQFAETNAKTVGELQSQVQELSGLLTAQQQQEAQAKVTADINRAVDVVAEESGLENKDYVNFRLNQIAESNPNFQKIWENRHTKPEALEQVLKAAGRELKGELDFKADPQIAENHRAAQESANTTATTAATEFNNSLEERLASAKTPAERDAIWNQLKNSG